MLPNTLLFGLSQHCFLICEVGIWHDLIYGGKEEVSEAKRGRLCFCLPRPQGILLVAKMFPQEVSLWPRRPKTEQNRGFSETQEEKRGRLCFFVSKNVPQEASLKPRRQKNEGFISDYSS
uniref:Uncharacterized protein n=1 Tax=Naja naja TaxID=35670 RepID=A0A8C6VKX9_NAJNA